MSQQQQVFTSGGTFTLPANLISTYILVTVVGGRGYNIYGGSTNPAQVNAQIAATLLPLVVVVGQNAPGRPAGGGYSGGGGGGGWKYGTYYPFMGGGGGGSSAVLSVTGTLYIEAGGGDGVGFTFNAGTTSPSVYPAGTGGGYASNTAGNAANVGLGAGSGGSQGGTGGNGYGGPGGVGHGGGTNGNTASGATSGAGVGSGGLGVAGAAASFAAAAPNVLNTTYGASGAQPQVTFTYHVADAPAAPVLLAPTNGVFLDANGQGVTFQGTYEAPSGDTGVLAGVALSLQTGAGATHYWNGTDFTSTVPVYVVPNTGAGANGNESFTIVVPPGVISDIGSPVYNWSMACQTAPFPLTGPFAATLSFTAVIPPTATITNPTGTVSTTTPTVSWTNTTPGGTQASYRYLIYTHPQVMPTAGNPVPGGAIYDSGVVASAATSFTLPSGILHSVNNYYGYLQIVDSAGSIPSLWAAAPFTVAIASANTVTLTVVAGTDPTTGMPAPHLSMTMTGTDALSFAWFQADYGDGVFEDIVAGLQPITSGAASIYDLGAPFNVAVRYQVRAAGVVAGNQLLTAWSSIVTLALPGIASKNWWVVPPTTPEAAIQISRLPATAASSATSGQTITSPPMPGSGLTASLAVEEWEQQGVFRGFGRPNALVVHGDLWNPEFDLAVYFPDPPSFAAFAAIRQQQGVLLLKSDMEGTLYWVTFGGDFNPGIVRETQRHKSPKRSLLVHCTPTDRYFPLNPFVPTN